MKFKLFKRKEKKEKEIKEIDRAVEGMIKELREIQSRIHEIIVNPPDDEDDDYDHDALMDQYNKCGKILVDLERIEKENQRNDSLETKKMMIPLWVAVIGLASALITMFGNGKFNIYIAKLLAHLEETGTIKTFPGRKWNWFIRMK